MSSSERRGNRAEREERTEKRAESAGGMVPKRLAPRREEGREQREERRAKREERRGEREESRGPKRGRQRSPNEAAKVPKEVPRGLWAS